MTATLAHLTFAEMLDANEREARKWQSWFERQPAEVLNLPVNIAKAKDVREMVQHIFAVELRYAERVLGRDVTPYEELPTGSLDELFGIGTQARGLFREYFAQATDDDLSTVLEFPTRSAGTLRASKRKICVHVMFHGVRHWAQLATALREQGHATDWPHDFLMSEVFE